MPARPQNLVWVDDRDKEIDERRGEVDKSITAYFNQRVPHQHLLKNEYFRDS